VYAQCDAPPRQRGAGTTFRSLAAAYVGPVLGGPWVAMGVSNGQGAPPPAPEEGRLLPERRARVDEAAQRLLARGRSAVTLGISHHGRLVYARCFGTTRYGGSEPVTERSLFAIASVTKPIAAAAVLLLLERGRFALDTPVGALVPDFGRNGKQAVTVGHLLTHTSGIDEHAVYGPHLGPYTTREAYFERVLRAPLVWPPGSYVAYSSAGYSALGELIGHVTGAPAAQFLAEELFAPLGMRDTFLSPPVEERPRIADCLRPDGADMLPQLLGLGSLAGSLFSTARDLLRFGNLFLTGGRTPGGRQVLSPTTAAAMRVDRTGHLPPAPGTPPGVRRIGLGWMLASPTLWACDLASPQAFGHQGSTGAYLLVDPAYELVVALIGNRWGGDPTGIAEVMNAAVATLAAA
jgi:CubicO group peptidase (beta-lactamase class C family)